MVSIYNEKNYANDVLRHGFISEVLPRLLGINGYVQIPTVKIKRNLPQLWYICQLAIKTNTSDKAWKLKPMNLAMILKRCKIT